SRAIRRSCLDDHGQRGLVHSGVPPHDLAHATSAAVDGKAPDPTGQAIIRGGARRASLEVTIRRHRSATFTYRSPGPCVRRVVGRARNLLFVFALVGALMPTY